MGGTTQTQDKTTSQQTQPWAPAQPVLTGILGQLGNINPNLTGAENSALSGLSASSGFLNQFTPQATGLANTLLAGGGPDRTGMINDAYAQYQKALQPFAGGDYVNPASNPALRGYLDTIQNDVSNQVNGMFAGAGRDLSGINLQALGRGIAQGEAPVLNDAYNTARNQQLAAINSLYGAGNTTGGLLSQLDQTRLANEQAGLGAAKTAQAFANDPYNQQLAIEAQRRGIPLSTLQAMAGITTPIAGLGQTSTGTSTQTTSTPFNAASLLPLGLMGGSSSLLGKAASGLGGLLGGGAGAGAAGGEAAELGTVGATAGSEGLAAGGIGEFLPWLFGLFSDERVKENKAEVGALFDGSPVYSYNYIGDPTTRIGLTAQDVERTRPDAVGEVGGIKAVDYDKATERSRQLGGLLSGVLDKPPAQSASGFGPPSGGLFGNAFGRPPGFGDMLNNNQNAILGYLAGALQGGNLGQSIGRGLQGWQQGQEADKKRQIPEATYRALSAAGVPDATARAAALNPDIMRAITPHYFQRLPTFGVIGQDAQGRRRYGFIDPFNRTIQPAEGPGPQSGPQR